MVYDVAKAQMTVNGLFKSTIHCLHRPGSQKSLKMDIRNIHLTNMQTSECRYGDLYLSGPNHLSWLPWEPI